MSEQESSGNPFLHQAERFRHEVEKMVERVRDQGEKALDVIGVKGLTGWHPPADIVETSDYVIVTMDLPDVSVDALDVKLAGNMLSISGSRPEATTSSGSIVHSRNRPTGEFNRSLPMPVPVDHEQVAAEVSDGVLIVRLAKSAEAKTRSVPISSADSGPETVE